MTKALVFNSEIDGAVPPGLAILEDKNLSVLKEYGR
jgi:hypothetical protein